MFYRFTDFIDYLFMLKDADMKKFNKKIGSFSRIQVLILDNFLISYLSNHRILNPSSFIENCDELGTSTIITSQYNPRT